MEMPRALTYAPGEAIFREGETGSCAYLVERGQVEISKQANGSRRVLAVLGPGELFGELAPIDGERRSATALALCETEVLPLSRAQLDTKIDEADPLVTLLLRLILDRLRSTQRAAECDEGEAQRFDAGVDPHQNAAYETARARAIERIHMSRALQEAVERREFELFYQPVVSCGAGYPTAGFEALLRWHRPDRGMLHPAEFIHIAEESGLIVPIGLWVLDTACRTLAEFEEELRKSHIDSPPLFMCVNVSARQLREPWDVDNLVRVIQDTGVDPGRIKLEITEGLLVQHPETAAAGLIRLKEAGVGLAVDDFGTGYSSLSYLHRFNLDTLKVDSSFVSSMLYNQDSLHIVRAITGLARELNMDVIAEGVEDDDELMRLCELECGYAQGFLFSRPVPAVQILKQLKSLAAGTLAERRPAAFRH